ncbi:MAG: methyltransferase domain-containing protein [Scytonema sp. PMC 1069.18]|nr:methyltransferase domain-containing protein [Scytonema sp. PMC 1069.18]MEC4885532.1 methyltransferase domain-containing protein [Scytonema sp. PMC 1070.18]
MTISREDNQWNAELYDRNHSFVSKLATDLVELLSPKSGECILDLGCGTGHLSYKIASHGAKVIGVDSSSTMIEKARKNYPQLDFYVEDARDLPYTKKFDAVFSNAVLHWIPEAEEAVVGIARALKPGGRFVAEFGGKGNIQAIVSAIANVMQSVSHPDTLKLNPWYFPSIGEYGSLIEKHGLQLIFATLFERLTPLEDKEQGIQNWLKMFANSFLSQFSTEQQEDIIAGIKHQLRPTLYRNGTWFADYVRLRVIAMKL